MASPPGQGLPPARPTGSDDQLSTSTSTAVFNDPPHTQTDAAPPTTHPIPVSPDNSVDAVDKHDDVELANPKSDPTRLKKRSRIDRINPWKRAVPPPVPETPEQSREAGASLWSRLFFGWMNPLMSVGYQRTLEATDVWAVNEGRSVGVLSKRLAERYAVRTRAGHDRPLLLALYDTFRWSILLGGFCSFIASMITALSPFVLRYVITFATESYAAAKAPAGQRRSAPPVGEGVGYVVALVVMIFIQTMCSNQFFYNSAILGSEARGTLTSLIFDKAMRLSGRARAGTAPVLDRVRPDFAPGSKEEQEWMKRQLKREKADEKKADKKAKEKAKASEKEGEKKESTADKNSSGPELVVGWSNGKIVNLMSTDTHRIELGCGQMHQAWTSPASIIITVALLLVNLTYSALPGLGLVFISVPLLGMTMKTMFARRRKINVLTESRVNLTQEILQAVRFVKLFAWEQSFSDRLDHLRKVEIGAIRNLLWTRNGVTAFAMSIPVFAAMLAFITFSMTGHRLEPGPIFSSLGLFNSLRLPMNILPMILSQVIDALAAVERIEEFLQAEEEAPGPAVLTSLDVAVSLDRASFTWEQGPEKAKSSTAPESKTEKKGPSTSFPRPPLPTSSDPSTPEEPFQITDLSLSFKPDELVAVVGAVGSGKSSLLAALSGEMRQTSGSVAVAAPRALCPQPAWIENATVRENILFGAPFVQAAYDRVVFASGLEPDFAQLPHRDATEIGERGITLSGGQRQRIGIARAAYARVVGVSSSHSAEPSQAKVLLLDDPLAAVDAHVGRHIFDHAIVGLLSGSCRILATHQLWVLPRCDRIVWLKDGRVAAFGTLPDLRSSYPEFDDLVGLAVDSAPTEKATEALAIVPAKTDSPGSTNVKAAAGLMSTEDQAVDRVPLSVYLDFLRRAGTVWIGPIITVLLIAAMGTNIVTGLWLAWWSGREFANLSDPDYAGIYASLGVIQALSMFAFAGAVSTVTTRASRALLAAAFRHVLSAPVSFFDTTPLGRITNRFAKDVDSLDNNVSDAARTFLLTFGMILSIVVLVAVYFPPFIAALGPAMIVVVFAASFFRSSARELRRHESVFRSTVFARFSEGVAGVATIRAYGSRDRVSSSLRQSIDTVNGASFLYTASQRWLAVRLDFVGLVLVAVAAILVLVQRNKVSPAISGLALSYSISITQMLQFSVRQLSEVEATMTAAERVDYYATKLPQEPAAIVPDVPSSWPSQGGIEFDSVSMRYRPGLPLVLRNFSLSIKPGERLALIGRTGAGKSSVLTALFRLVDPTSGSIRIDGTDIRSVGLYQLRSRLAIIPQDPTLFRGTVRSNLDPFGAYADDKLWLALRRSGLAEPNSSASVHLDDTVGDGGDNFSLGQRQLLALARALVRSEARIVVCDEATSSVDIETDARVQQTMMSCFGAGGRNGAAAAAAVIEQNEKNKDKNVNVNDDNEEDGPRTLITIAHRLRTIIGYDRICVLQAGEIAELDAPLSLFDKRDGIFRSMCDRSGITREHVVAAESGAFVAVTPVAMD